MTTADVLRAVRERLVKVGWRRGTTIDLHSDQPACVSTSVHRAVNEEKHFKECGEARVLLDYVALARMGGKYSDASTLRPAAYYNDSVARDVDDILSLVDEAIAKAEATT